MEVVVSRGARRVRAGRTRRAGGGGFLAVGAGGGLCSGFSARVVVGRKMEARHPRRAGVVYIAGRGAAARAASHEPAAHHVPCVTSRDTARADAAAAACSRVRPGVPAQPWWLRVQPPVGAAPVGFGWSRGRSGCGCG